MLSKNKSFVNTNQNGSSLSLPAHGRAGARATSLLAAHFAKRNTKFGGGGKARAGKKSFPPTPLLFARQGVQFRVCGAKRGNGSISFRKGSREVYNYSTKTNLFGNDCSARRVHRAPQGKIRFCFRRKIPEFPPITTRKSSNQKI